jgi:hypothetical protein
VRVQERDQTHDTERATRIRGKDGKDRIGRRDSGQRQVAGISMSVDDDEIVGRINRAKSTLDACDQATLLSQRDTYSVERGVSRQKIDSFGHISSDCRTNIGLIVRKHTCE